MDKKFFGTTNIDRSSYQQSNLHILLLKGFRLKKTPFMFKKLDSEIV